MSIGQVFFLFFFALMLGKANRAVDCPIGESVMCHEDVEE